MPVYIKILPIVFLLISCAARLQPSSPVVQTPVKTPVVVPQKKDTVPVLSSHEVFIAGILESNPKLAYLVKERKNLNLQILFTEIDRNSDNIPSFKTSHFNTDSSGDFYPGTAVKLLLAEAALDKLNKLPASGITKYTTVLSEKSYKSQVAGYNDPQTPEGKPTLAGYLRRSFIANDEEATNRLYEFVGQKELSEFLKQKGFGSVRLHGRLGDYYSKEDNRRTNEMNFYDERNRLVYSKKEQVADARLAGHAAVNEDFPGDNFITLYDLEKSLRQFLFDENPDSKVDQEFILKYMSQLPGESIFPFYEEKHYPANFSKYMSFDPANKNIRFFNVSGEGFGFITDAAYILNLSTGKEFILALTMDLSRLPEKANSLADGRTLFSRIAKTFYDYNNKQPKSFAPLMGKFNIAYDK